jgi:hypothetical protein
MAWCTMGYINNIDDLAGPGQWNVGFMIVMDYLGQLSLTADLARKG